MNMKTVWDAVNELKGDLSNSYNLYDGGETHIFVEVSSGRIGTVYVVHKLHSNYKAICTVEEFNELVAEMSNNFGKGKTEIKRYWDGKEELEVGLCVDAYIDSTKTQTFNGEIVYIGQSFGKNHYVIQFTNWLGVFDLSGIVEPPVELIDGEAYQFECDGATFKGITTDRLMPVERAVYTQEMADNGVLPSVGMDCLIYNAELMKPEYEKATIDFIGYHVIVYSSESCTERTCNLELVEFKPIDTRTDKEKAIEDLSKLVGDCESDYGILKAIIAGKVHGVTWSIKDES